MKPVSKASESIEPVSKAEKVDRYEALGTLGKKAKKPRSLPPKRAMRMIIDPYRYGHMHVNGAVLAGANSEIPKLPEGTWEFQYDEIRPDDISSQMDPSLVSGRWVYRAADQTQEDPAAGDSADVQSVPGKRKRVAEQLEGIAATSVFPDTLQDVEGKQSTKKAKTAASADNRRPALEEDDIPALDDDDIWGAAPVAVGQESVSLFDTNPSRKARPNVAPALVPVRAAPKTVVPDEVADLSDVDFEDDDVLFGGTGEVMDQVSSLFANEKASTRKNNRAVDPSSEEDADDASANKAASTGAGMSLSKFASSEKQKGLSVLQALGIDLAEQGGSASEAAEANAVSFEEDEDDVKSTKAASKTANPQMAWLYDDEDDEPVETSRHAARRLSDALLHMDGSSATEADGPGVAGRVMRLRGGGGESQQKERDDEDDSDSDSESSEEEESSSDEEEDEKENGVSEKKGQGKQSLKDMFAAQPECEFTVGHFPLIFIPDANALHSNRILLDGWTRSGIGFGSRVGRSQSFPGSGNDAAGRGQRCVSICIRPDGRCQCGIQRLGFRRALLFRNYGSTSRSS